MNKIKSYLILSASLLMSSGLQAFPLTITNMTDQNIFIDGGTLQKRVDITIAPKETSSLDFDVQNNYGIRVNGIVWGFAHNWSEYDLVSGQTALGSLNHVDIAWDFINAQAETDYHIVRSDMSDKEGGVFTEFYQSGTHTQVQCSNFIWNSDTACRLFNDQGDNPNQSIHLTFV